MTPIGWDRALWQRSTKVIVLSESRVLELVDIGVAASPCGVQLLTLTLTLETHRAVPGVPTRRWSPVGLWMAFRQVREPGNESRPIDSRALRSRRKRRVEQVLSMLPSVRLGIVP